MGQISAQPAAMLRGFEGFVMNNEKRPVGPLVAFDGAQRPSGRDLQGRYVRLERIDPARHGADIWKHIQGHDYIWDYLFEAPPADESAFMGGLKVSADHPEWMGYGVCVDGVAVGYAFFLNISPDMGCIEVGNINFSPSLQRTPAATEAMYLMMREAFALGFRRYEWKCNALNMPSRRAAQRFGFSWEGIFRQHYVVKGRNRDTAWFGMTDADWPQIQGAFETWLSVDNFDDAGQQRQSLRRLTAPHLVARDPAQPA